MRISHSLLAPFVFAALAAPLPALAQESGDSSVREMSRTLADPATQEQVAEIGAALVAVVLQMPVGPLANAAAQLPGGENLPPVDPDTRVADVVGPEGERAPELVRRELPRVIGAMGAMAGALDAMLPQLRAMAESLPRNYPRTR